MYKYSIIIPVYNAEKTLERCISSLVKQNCNEAEIILINDGSTDASDDLCIQFAKKYPWIKYIYQKNMGVSAARNRGIAEASGQYILFVDSDDYVTDNYFCEINKLLRLHDTDLIIFSRYDCKAEKVFETRYQPFFSVTSDELIKKLSDLICRKIINGPVTKIYKKSIIDEYRVKFPVGVSIAEDRAFNIKYALHIKSLRVTDIPLYYVSLDNDGSLSRRKKECFKEQSEIIWNDINTAISHCELPNASKQYVIDALNFGECRVVYTYAKMSWQDKEKRSMRIKKIKLMCEEINARKYTYPNTRYCTLITLPVRFKLAWLIDAMAWKLTH